MKIKLMATGLAIIAILAVVMLVRTIEPLMR